MDARVKAIRDHVLVGTDTCAYVNECFGNDELSKMLDDCEQNTIDAAVSFAVEMEDVQMSRMLDGRFGEDTDDELVVYREWNARKAAAGWKD